MKKKYFLLAFLSLSLIGFTSCDKDDEKTTPPPVQTDLLVGKWDLKTMSVKLSIDGEVVQEIVDESVEGQITMQFNFKADKSVTLYQYTPATEEEEAETYEGIGTYERKGNQVTIAIDGEPITFQLIVNDQTNLHLGLNVEEDYEGVAVKQESIYKFKKM